MSNLAYTVQGTFNKEGKFNLAVCIPAEPFRGAYTLLCVMLKKFTAKNLNNEKKNAI